MLFAVNKLDSRQRADNLYEFYALGIDQLFSISAEHGLGIPDLMDEVVQRFPNAEESDEKTEEKAPLRISASGAAQRRQIDSDQSVAGFPALRS